MKLKPLEQWICDNCGQLIENTEHGWLEWLSEQGARQLPYHGFKIVHHASHSPRKPYGNCYFYDEPPKGQSKMDLPLREFVSSRGIVQLLSFIDVGPHHAKSFRGPYVKDLREWTELFRRLMLPYYEEARMHWGKADADGFFNEANEIWIYLPDILKEVIKLYGD